MDYRQNIEYTIKAKGPFNLGLKELIEYKELFYFFTWRDIKVKYKQTVLGFLWAIIQPLLMMVIFTAFFGRALNVPSDGAPYPIFVYSGLLLWNVFSSGITNAGNGMVSNANIIKKIYFPRLIIPVSAILVSLFDFFISFVLFLFVIGYYLIAQEYEMSIWKIFFYLPLSLFITIFATLGPGCLLAALNVKYRDVRYLIPFLVQILLFLTPVIYPISVIENQAMKIILALNPISGAIDLFRFAVSNSPINVWLFILSVASSVFFFLFGIYYFKRTEAYFADIA